MHAVKCHECRSLSEVIIISHFSRVDYEVTVQTDIALATLQWHAVILCIECCQDFNFRFEGLSQWQTFMTFHLCQNVIF